MDAPKTQFLRHCLITPTKSRRSAVKKGFLLESYNYGIQKKFVGAVKKIIFSCKSWIYYCNSLGGNGRNPRKIFCAQRGFGRQISSPWMAFDLISLPLIAALCKELNPIGHAAHTRPAMEWNTCQLSSCTALDSRPWPRFESMSFVVNILACKLKIVNNRNWKKT